MLKSRKMDVQDIQRVYEIEVASFKTPWSMDAFRSEIVENTLATYIVLELDDVIIGYGGMWQIMDEVHITNVAIDVPYRGKGFSKDLMHAMIEYAVTSGFKHMTLEVRVSNQTAISLYEKLGFYSVGKRPKYYIDTGEDALVMWKSLSEVPTV